MTFLILRKRLQLTKNGNWFLFSFLFSIAALIVIGPLSYRFGSGDATSPPQRILQFAQYFLMGWVGVTLISFAILEILQALTRPFDPKKRIFLTEGFAKGVLSAATLASVGGLVMAEAGPQITPVNLILPTLPKSFDGITLAQISDIHIGPLLHRDYLDHVVDQVMSIKADIILITGDLVDGTLAQLKEQVAPILKLKAKEGVYFCTGNHEFYSGAEEWMNYLESIGIHVFNSFDKARAEKRKSCLLVFTTGTEKRSLLNSKPA